jgi:hypothetical protein
MADTIASNTRVRLIIGHCALAAYVFSYLLPAGRFDEGGAMVSGWAAMRGSVLFGCGALWRFAHGQTVETRDLDTLAGMFANAVGLYAFVFFLICTWTPVRRPTFRKIGIAAILAAAFALASILITDLWKSAAIGCYLWVSSPILLGIACLTLSSRSNPGGFEVLPVKKLSEITKLPSLKSDESL